MHIKDKLRNWLYSVRFHIELNIILCGIALVIDDENAYFFITFWNDDYRFGFEFDYLIDLWFTMYYGRFEHDEGGGTKHSCSLLLRKYVEQES